MVKFRLPLEKLTFSRLGQLIFTFKQISKLAWRTNRWYFVGALVLGIFWGVTTPVGFYLEKLVIDRLVAGIGTPEITVVLYPVAAILALRVGVEVGRDVISRVQRLFQVSMARLFTSELEVILGEKLAELDIATIEDPGFSNRREKITRESGRRAWGLMMPLVDIPNYLAGFISGVGVAFLLSPAVAVVIFVLSLPQFFVSAKYIREEYELETRLSPLRRLWGWLSYYLVRNRNFMELKVLGLSGHLGGRLRKVSNEIAYSHVDLSKRQEFAQFWSVLPATVLGWGIYVWLAFLALGEKITVGSVEFYVRSIRSIQSNLISLVSSFLEIYENYLYVVDLVWFLNLTPQIDPKVGKKLGEPVKEIVFKDVWFRYRPDQDWILKGVNFEVKMGERVAMVGENGAGKSTIIKLLARFYDPDRGKVLVNGKDLREVKSGDWHKKLAILFQEFELYPFTAREAIGYGDLRRVERLEEVKEVAAGTGVDEYIGSLPLKYENPLDPQFEKGVRPSFGQMQRIGIARMLFRKQAEVLMMDEPTSMVDPEGEEKIFDQLTRKARDKTLVFVTQRFSTVRNTDKILVVDRGKIIEKGSHEELMKLGGKYARLFALQAKGYGLRVKA